MCIGSYETVRIFSPCFGLNQQKATALASSFADLQLVLGRRNVELHVLLINDDPSNIQQSRSISEVTNRFDFIMEHKNPENLGNAKSIRIGYDWICEVGNIVDKTIGGSCDSDGEHDPLSFVRCFDKIDQGICDGVIGSIDFPEHFAKSINEIADLAFMKSLAADQSSFLDLLSFEGFDNHGKGILSIHSPGFQMHRARCIKHAISELEKYVETYTNLYGELPTWGMHFVMNVMLQTTGAKQLPIYLPCLGPPPNRNRGKRWQQMEAAMTHMKLITQMQSTNRLSSKN